MIYLPKKQQHRILNLRSFVISVYQSLLRTPKLTHLKICGGPLNVTDKVRTERQKILVSSIGYYNYC